MSGQREMFLRNGMNGFLAKPIEMRKLDETLREWIPEERRVNPGAAANKAPSRGPDEPFEIEGVSTETGLRNSGGSVAAYANILMDFCRDAKERAQQIKQCLADDNISLYLTLVHALKGASRAVGAAEFAEFAERMEDVAQCENMEVIAKMTDKMLTALQRLIEEIRDALEDRFAAGDARAAEESSVPRLETLKSALSDMDIATVNDLMLEYAGISFDVRTSNELFEIERLILLFEYDAAIKRIDNLINAAAKYAP
jgi:HPt (histidine-containing phosphotransfer) domain-containing protein